MIEVAISCQIIHYEDTKVTGAVEGLHWDVVDFVVKDNVKMFESKLK